ncbi:hypothetical protein B0T14DRAFT_561229 [Immersiella caudata]|uniref:Uncharacterized protein n=1 Tax=Immersiella caudata TaxID=314043 RepID=A0AA39XH92_9PEZI|nr:hypothetical protein B0T14DRAFT_561229 [Immersiella caudata]
MLLCISSGPDTKTTGATPFNSRDTLELHIPDDNPDIGGFISAELERCIASGTGLQGMFLWVTLQIDSLCDAKTDEAIRLDLADLPKDLTETFICILRKAGGSPIPDPLQSRILKITIAARRPLTIQELREALSVVPGDTLWNPTRLLNSLHAALVCCGSHLTVDEEVLGEIIIAYLNYAVFETHLYRAVAPQVSVEATTSKIIVSVAGPRQVHNLALKLLRSTRQSRSDLDIGKVLAEAGRYRLVDSPERFYIFAYANAHWESHVANILGNNPVMSSMLVKLLQVAPSPDIWLELEDCSLVSWAAKCGEDIIVAVLAEQGAELEAVGKID